MTTPASRKLPTLANRMYHSLPGFCLLVLLHLVMSAAAQQPTLHGISQPGSALNNSARTETAPHIASDSVVATLLAVNWYDMSPEARRRFASQLERTLKMHPQTTLKPHVWSTLGDIYHSLDNPARVRKWYRKVIAYDSVLARETPAGFRHELAAWQLLHRDSLFACWIIYGMALILIVAAGFRSRGKIDLRGLLRYGSIALAAVTTVMFAVIFIDRKAGFAEANKLSKSEHAQHLIVEPLVALGVADSPFLLGLVLAACCIPCLYAVLSVSFRRSFPRFVTVLVSLLLCVALWTHLFLIRGYTETLEPDYASGKYRLFLLGELESLLVKDPGKVLRAKTDFAESKNVDLQIFIKEQFSRGLRQSGKKAGSYDRSSRDIPLSEVNTAFIQIETIRASAPVDFAAIRNIYRVNLTPYVARRDSAQHASILEAIAEGEQGNQPHVHSQFISKSLQKVFFLHALELEDGIAHSGVGVTIDSLRQLYENLSPTVVRRSQWIKRGRDLDDLCRSALSDIAANGTRETQENSPRVLKHTLLKAFALSVLYEIEGIGKNRGANPFICEEKEIELKLFYESVSSFVPHDSFRQALDSIILVPYSELDIVAARSSIVSAFADLDLAETF